MCNYCGPINNIHSLLDTITMVVYIAAYLRFIQYCANVLGHPVFFGFNIKSHI